MKDFSFSRAKHFRYERKFYIENLAVERIEAILKFHPAIFREIYHERQINNIYFDSFNLQHYFENIDGVSRRLKVRVRWYGDSFGFIENPMLELKLKHNLHVGKLIYPLRSFAFDGNFSIDAMRKVFEKSSLQETLKLHLIELNFSLFNCYRRKYFLSSSRKYRITIDVGMQACALSPYCNSFLHKMKDYANVIIELKYNDPHDQFVGDITSYFPFRVTRSSKYVDGITKLYQ